MSNRQIGTIVLVIAMLIVVVSVLFTNNLAHKLQVEEQKNMAIWADATQQLIVAEDDADIDFFMSIIEKNTTIPVFICDKEGNILSSRNVSSKSKIGKHGPIELKIDEHTTQYIYWDDSRLLTSLRIVPYAQFALIFICVVRFTPSNVAPAATRAPAANQMVVSVSVKASITSNSTIIPNQIYSSIRHPLLLQ